MLTCALLRLYRPAYRFHARTILANRHRTIRLPRIDSVLHKHRYHFKGADLELRKLQPGQFKPLQNKRALRQMPQDLDPTLAAEIAHVDALVRVCVSVLV